MSYKKLEEKDSNAMPWDEIFDAAFNDKSVVELATNAHLRPLNNDDLRRLTYANRNIDVMHAKFLQVFDEKKSSMKALFSCIGFKFWWWVLSFGISPLSTFAAVYFQNLIIRDFHLLTHETLWYLPWTYAVYMFLLRIFGVIYLRLISYRFNNFAIDLTKLVQKIVYHRTVIDNNVADNTPKTLSTTIITIDSLTFNRVFTFIPAAVWSLPEFFFGLGMGVWTGGKYTIVGFLCLIIYFPINRWALSKLNSVRTTRRKYTDERANFFTEALAAIKIIKFNGWEDSIIDRILKIRDNEMYWILRANSLVAAIMPLANLMPTAGAMISIMMVSMFNPLYCN